MKDTDMGGVDFPVRIAWKKIFAPSVMSFLIIGPVLGSAKGPRLLFTENDLPVLRDRIAKEPHVEIWQGILAQAETYSSSGTQDYADPTAVDKGPDRYGKTIGHSFGRRLTNWMEALGFAYQMTGEERFGDHGARLLVAAARTLPATDPRMAQSYAGGRGDFMRGLALGYDWLEGRLADSEKRTVQETGAGYIRNILNEARQENVWWVPYHNYMGVSIGAAGCLALALRDAYPKESIVWLEECVALMNRWLDRAFDKRGANCEGTSYAVYALSNATLFMDALARNGGPNLFEHPRLRFVPHFYSMSLLPGESVFDARNDASYDGFWDPFMLRLAGEYKSGLAKWLFERCATDKSFLRIVWDNSVEPLNPESAREPQSEHFEGRGLCVFRTGWQLEDVMFSLEAGPFYRKTHNQADKGHFTLYGLGHRWAIDSGYGNNQDLEGRAQTIAHNCVLIDGMGQALSGAGLGTSGSILAYENNARFGYALADCADAYNQNSDGHPGIGVHHALRHALFIHPSQAIPAYVILLDDIQRDEEAHDYTWLLHTDANLTIRAEGSSATVKPSELPIGATDSPRLQVHVFSDTAPKLEVDHYEDHPRLKVTSRSDNPNFVAFLLLLPAGTAEPDVNLTEMDEAFRMEVQWSERTDRLTWPYFGKRKPEVLFSSTN